MKIVFEPTALDFIFLAAGLTIVILAGVAIYFVRKNRRLDGVDKKFVNERWRKIEELFSFGKDMNFKLAVIEADKLLDEVLKQMHFSGQTTAERLKLASYKFPKLKKVWWAHKVRNHVVHDARYNLRHGETKIVLKLFRAALKELKAL